MRRNGLNRQIQLFTGMLRGIIIMQWSDVIRRVKKMELLRKDQKKQTGDADADGFFTALGVDGHLYNDDAIEALKESAYEDWKEDE
jgi:hypothetical protein